MVNYDLIIVGSGPAGISAGIYALRAGVNVAVIDDNNSSLLQAKQVQNYYGIKSISGKELIKNGEDQFSSLGGLIVKGQVLKINKDYQMNTFLVKTNKGTYHAKAIILAMGSPKKKTNIELEKFDNVSYCAICDGFFYKNKTVAVLGDGDFAFSECEELEKVVGKIYLIAKDIAQNVKNGAKIEKINKEILKFEGKNILNKIIFKDNSSIEIDGLFVAEGVVSSFEIAKQLGLMVNNNFVEVDKNYMTNVAGVFAAGDMIGGLLQISKAVSDGANAGLEAVRYLKIMELKND